MFRFVSASVLALTLSGCATITRGTADQIQIVSTHDGAKATTSNGQNCITPCMLLVGRKDVFTVHYEKEGFVPQDVEVKTQTGGYGAAGLAGNVILGGVVGIGADIVTGASLDHVPNPVSVTLEAETPVAAPKVSKVKPKRLPADAGKTS